MASVSRTLSKKLSKSTSTILAPKRLDLVSVRTHYLQQPNPTNKTLIFRQLFDQKSFTFTYLLGCAATKEAILIDPVLEQVDRDLKLVEDLGLKLILGANTHVHADHVTATGRLKEMLGEENFQSVLSLRSGGKADIHIEDGDRIRFGEQRLDVLETPGHTDGCLTYVMRSHSLAFTGDTLLVRGCGRTDFQQGSSETLYDSIHGKIFTLPEHYALYPAHDYKGHTKTTVGEEKNLNPRLTLTKEGFVRFMEELGLAYPKLMDVAVPANMACGEISKEAVEGEDDIFDKLK